jgi:hypothetical protein
MMPQAHPASAIHRNRGTWTDRSTSYLNSVREVLDRLVKYWPLTLRQVFYQLVAALIIPNRLGEYKRLSRVLTKARLDGLVPWEALEDRSRRVLQPDVWLDAETFIETQLDWFLDGYRRDLLQSQASALEVWVEKDALAHVCQRVADPLGVPVAVARGFSSTSHVHEGRKRIEQNADAGRPTVILYFGDLDPSGYEMLPAMLYTLQHEMHLGELVEGVGCALTAEQVETYGLPHSIEALKDTDSRAKKYRRQFGDLAVELDALPPAHLEALVRLAIESRIDAKARAAERKREAKERARIAALKDAVQALVLGQESPP